MRNIAMVVSYDGTHYEGYQSQPSGKTVQDKIEEAILHLTGERVKTHGSGRTDAGVHARGQVINFHTKSRIPIERWGLAMNTRLPSDIVVSHAQEVPADFHSRRSAKRKTYRYTLQNSAFPDVMNRYWSLHIYRPLDVVAMKQAISYLEGEHDFSSFCSTGASGDSRVRTIYKAQIAEWPNENSIGKQIVIDITGNGFLYNMIRIIVGTLLQVGQGQIEPEQMQSILVAKDRSRAGPTAPPQGLKLWNVEYGEIQLPT